MKKNKKFTRRERGRRPPPPQPQRSEASERIKHPHPISPNNKKSVNNKKVKPIIILLLIVGGASLALLYFYLQYQQAENIKNDQANPFPPLPAPDKDTKSDQLNSFPPLPSPDKDIKSAQLLKSACQNFFANHTYNFVPGKSIRTTLIGEIHGVNEQEVVDCLASQAAEGDHLLIEYPDAGEEIACDSVNPIYKRFNGKLKCFGSDVSTTDEARRLYSDFAFRANFLASKSSLFFDNAKSGNAVIKKMKSFAEHMAQQPITDPRAPDKQFNVRNAKYLKQLANKMSGLSISQMGTFLITENNRLAERADHYEARSRKGPTNEKLVNEVEIHQEELSSSGYRLFGVFGTNHVDPKRNSQLKNFIDRNKEPIAILTPKQAK